MHLRLHLALLASCVSCVSCASAWRRAALDTWRFASLDGGVALANVSTPGSTHTHLLDGGVLPQDPYFRFNELDLRWVAQATWVYETPLPPLETDAGAARVTFEALDGVAHVSLNGQALGPAAVNSFRPHTFTLPTKQLRRDGSDSLRVVFTPPLEYMTSAAAAYPYEIPATRNFNVWAEPTHRPFLRKAGSDFGWDWGPAFATSGITGPVVVEWLSPSDEPADHGEVAIAQLSNLHVEYEFPARDDWSVVCGNVTVDVESVSEPSQLKVRLFLDGKQHGDDIALGDAVSSDELAQFAEATLKFEIPNPILWWPAGYGEAHLYDVRVEVLKSDSIVSVVSHHVGFRTVELVQDKTNDGGITGATFFFRINGVPIFIKGANWIPNDSFPTRVTPEKVNYLLKSALAANMNMIRVWGGGRYESDHFYETCDRLGLLVWHEFMFACAMYPRNSAFLEEVTQEVLYQTKRLRKYTSIAIWGGNNENENMMESFANGDFMPAGKTFNRDVAVVDFTVIFVDIVRPIVLALDKSRPFVDTSPSNGLLSEHPYVKRWGKSTNEVAYGDVHYYNYSGDCQDPVMYPHARFISEFGFQSVPSIYALRDISNDSDWTSFQSFWKLLKFRERHENGTLQMTAQLARRFHVPFPFLNENWLNTPLEGKFDIDIQKRVSAYAYLTQIQQGLCYQTAIETWRRGRNEALGGTMGILYWQLNDVWQGTSWSSMEYNGRWKSLQFAVQRAYSPVLVTVHSEGDMISIYGINDHMDEDVALTLTYELVATGTGRVIYSQASSKTRVPRLSSEPLDHLSVSSLLKSSATCHKTSCFLRVRCTAEARCEDAFYFFSPFKVLRLCHGRVVIDRVTSVSSQSEVAFDVSVRSENFVALFVELESPQILGLWTKNSIHLVGNETQTFRFTAANASVALSADAFQQQLEVRWLQQIYESQAEVMIQ